MHFVEHLFGFSPDGGSGLFEMLLVVLPIAAVAMLAIRRGRNKRAVA